MVRELQDYKWCSHHYYVGKGKKDSIVDTDRVLRMFPDDKVVTQKVHGRWDSCKERGYL